MIQNQSHHQCPQSPSHRPACLLDSRVLKLGCRFGSQEFSVVGSVVYIDRYATALPICPLASISLTLDYRNEKDREGEECFLPTARPQAAALLLAPGGALVP